MPCANNKADSSAFCRQQLHVLMHVLVHHGKPRAAVTSLATFFTSLATCQLSCHFSDSSAVLPTGNRPSHEGVTHPDEFGINLSPPACHHPTPWWNQLICSDLSAHFATIIVNLPLQLHRPDASHDSMTQISR
jgi:hypothetical protein